MSCYKKRQYHSQIGHILLLCCCLNKVTTVHRTCLCFIEELDEWHSKRMITTVLLLLEHLFNLILGLFTDPSAKPLSMNCCYDTSIMFQSLFCSQANDNKNALFFKLKRVVQKMSPLYYQYICIGSHSKLSFKGLSLVNFLFLNRIKISCQTSFFFVFAELIIVKLDSIYEVIKAK